MPDPRLPDPFDGQPIVKTTVSIRNAGDGLSEALATDQQTLHMGERVVVVLEARVAGANVAALDEDDPGGALKITYVLKATERATLSAAEGEHDVLGKLLDAQQQRNEEAKGIMRLVPDDTPEADTP
jgi:hypothetical protein